MTETMDRGVIFEVKRLFYSFWRRIVATSQNTDVKTDENNEDLSTVDCRYLLLGQACADDCRYNHKLPKKEPLPLPKENDNNKPRLTGANAIARNNTCYYHQKFGSRAISCKKYCRYFDAFVRNNTCWYHQKFGSRAFKCEKFCSYFNYFNSKNNPSVWQH